MRKIVTAQFEIEYSDELYGDWTNQAILNRYVENDWDFLEDAYGENFEVIAVNDTVESEKADADSTREIGQPTGLDEVPC